MLSYRSKCIIHTSLDLHPRSSSPAIMELTKDGVRINPNKNAIKSKILAFNYDGTYYPTGDYECVVYMQCDECTKIPTLKSRGLGFTALDNIYNNCYFYNFIISSSFEDNTFSCSLIEESIKYMKDDRFYHLNFNINDGEAHCTIGNCGGEIILTQMIEGLLYLDLPSLDMSRIKNVDQIINKLKIYTLFS